MAQQGTQFGAPIGHMQGLRNRAYGRNGQKSHEKLGDIGELHCHHIPFVNAEFLQRAG
jgi:hypothetical protein